MNGHKARKIRKQYHVKHVRLAPLPLATETIELDRSRERIERRLRREAKREQGRPRRAAQRRRAYDHGRAMATVEKYVPPHPATTARRSGGDRDR